MKALDGKVAWVTGAGSGLGRAIARAYAREGAKVGVADLDAPAAARTVAAIEADGGAAMALAMDVTREDQVDAAANALAAKFGGIDVLVSNAGFQHVAAIADLDFADWRRVVAVHLDGGFLTARAALRRMIAQGRGGSLVFMGSVHAKEASPLKGPYVAAKHGLAGLVRVLAKEGAAHGVRSNLICPGFVRTPLVEKQIPKLAAEMGLSEDAVVRDVMLRSTVDGIFTTEDDVADVAVFLAGFRSNALTGQSIVVSHGWHMG